MSIVQFEEPSTVGSGIVESDNSSNSSIATDISHDQIAQPTSKAYPVEPAKDRILLPTKGIPYYAAPKILVHEASESSLSERSGPRTIDEVLAGNANKRRVSFSGEEPQPARARTLPPILAAEHETSETPATPTGTTIHKKTLVKKRSLFLRKARNLAARKTILKLTLGRQLAVPTKEALRHLANGESVIVIEPQTSEALP